MEKFLKECGAFSVRNLSDEGIVKLYGDLAERNMIAVFANSRTGIVFKISQVEVKPEVYGRFRIEMGSIIGGGTDPLDNFFCDNIKISGGAELTVTMTSGDRLVGTLNANYMFGEEAFARLAILYARYLDKDNMTRRMIEGLQSYDTGIRTGKLDGFNLECSWYGGPDSCWNVNVDFRKGMVGVSRGSMDYTIYHRPEKSVLKDLFDSLKKEKYMRDAGMEPVCDGSVYELTLFYKTMKRKVTWVSGNETSEFIRKVEGLLGISPEPEE